MGYVTRERQGLSVVESAADERSVQAALTQLDSRLFLSREIDQRYGCWVWSVLHYLSDDRPPLPVCRWDDDHGRPLPLTHALVDKVRSQEGRGPDVLREVDTHNRALIAGIDREADEITEDVANDVAKFHKRGGQLRAKSALTGAKRQRRRDQERKAGLR